MRLLMGMIFIGVLVGCASPTPPPKPVGEYRPVNASPKSPSANGPKIFDFHFEGDIVAALDALHTIQPQLNVMPPMEAGAKVVPIPVKVHLSKVDLETALQAIGGQGGDAAEVVLTTTGNPDTNKVFIKFHPSKKAKTIEVQP